jgi:predicted phosphoribosyltransferase
MYRIFKNREEAGEALAQHLERLGWREMPPDRLFGLARGGLAVALPVARSLHRPLEALIVRKIGAPDNEEFGVGALCEDGVPLFSQQTLRALKLQPEDLTQVTDSKRQELNQRIQNYRGGALQWKSPSRSILVIDDGLATGISAETAARFLRRKGAKKISLAIPVAASDSAAALWAPGELYDEVIAIERIDAFGSVGSWYDDFHALSDEEVRKLLRSGSVNEPTPRSFEQSSRSRD